MPRYLTYLFSLAVSLATCANLLAEPSPKPKPSHTFPILVTGAVNQPGRYQVPASVTHLDVLFKAGGLHDNAQSIIVFRETAEGKIEEIEAAMPIMCGPKVPPLLLEPGDAIHVFFSANKSPEPTTTSVMPAAKQPARRP